LNHGLIREVDYFLQWLIVVFKKSHYALLEKVNCKCIILLRPSEINSVTAAEIK